MRFSKARGEEAKMLQRLSPKKSNEFCEVIFMKKWYPFSVFLALILAFVAAPLVQSVEANANISGTARLRLATSYTSMDRGGISVNCNQNGSKRCLILKYNIANVDPNSTVRVGVYKDNCKGTLLENLVRNNIPVGDGRDGSQVIAHVNFLQIPNQPSLLFCVFNVKTKETVIGQGKFTVSATTAIASVTPA